VIDTPIFLIGAERSGSTLLRLILDHHPDIALNLESDFLVTRLADDGTQPDMADYRRCLVRDRVFRLSRFSIDARLDYAGLVNDFLRQKQGDKRLVGATVHHDFRRLPFLWPQAKYIYLYRDGRDVANSAMHMGWAGNVYVAADFWIHAERDWAAMRTRMPEDHWLEVRYEDLVADVRGALGRVCGFLGVEYDERMFDYASHGSYGKPDARLSQQWKSKLSEQDIRLLEAKIGGDLQRRGYALSAHPPLQVSHWRDGLLRLQSRAIGLRNRIAKYGLLLTAQEVTSRRLGLSAWHQAAQVRIDAIIDQGLR
jgi:hypothetical protein